MAGIQEIAVNLIRADKDIMTKTDRGKPFKFIFSKNTTDRVMRITEHIDFGFRSAIVLSKISKSIS